MKSGSAVLTIQIQAKISWAMKRLSSGKFLAVCDPLGVTVEGKNQAELRSLIEETHHYLFLDLLVDGELDKFLRDRGWSVPGGTPRRPPGAGVRFEVPFHLVPATA